MGCEGEDWASYQDAAPATSGLGFAFVKATEGTGYVNPLHDAQVAHARAEGLVVGHYHFARPGSAADQSAYFLQHAKAQPGDLLALDWEDDGVTGAAKDALLRQIQHDATEHRALLYCDRDFWLNRDGSGFAGDGLWIADPSAAKGAPRITTSWLIHQYADTSGLDRDYTTMTAAQLRTWAVGGATPTPEDDVATTPADAKVTAKGWLDYDGAPAPAAGSPYANSDAATNTTWSLRYWSGDVTLKVREAAASATATLDLLKAGTPVTLTDDQLDALAAKVAPVVAEQLAELLAARLQS